LAQKQEQKDSQGLVELQQSFPYSVEPDVEVAVIKTLTSTRKTIRVNRGNM